MWDKLILWLAKRKLGIPDWLHNLMFKLVAGPDGNFKRVLNVLFVLPALLLLAAFIYLIGYRFRWWR